MRQNSFGERIATHVDTVDECLEAWDFPTLSYAEVYDEDDEQFRFGGRLLTDAGDDFGFDCFGSLEAAQQFAEQFVEPWNVKVF